MAVRSLMLIPRVPSTFIPSLVMPFFLTISFAGQFSGLVNLPGFPSDNALDWFVPMTMLQGAAFAGITTSMGVARDLESGFYDRFLLSPVPRTGLVMGPLVAAVCRAFIPITLMFVVAVLGGASFEGGLLGASMMVVACTGFAFAAGAWALGLALRFKTMQVTPLMQIGIFLTVFLSTAQMPLDLIDGWLHQVATYNPMTFVLQLARQGLVDGVSWDHTWPGLVALGGSCIALTLWAARGMQKVIS